MSTTALPEFQRTDYAAARPALESAIAYAIVVDGGLVVRRKPNGQTAICRYKGTPMGKRSAEKMLERVRQVPGLEAAEIVPGPAGYPAGLEPDVPGADAPVSSDEPQVTHWDPEDVAVAHDVEVVEPAGTHASVVRSTAPAPEVPDAEPTTPKPLSGLAAVELVIRENGGPMRLRDAARAVIERGLAPNLKGKTPEATITAQVMVQAKKKGGRFVKVDRGVVDVRRDA